MPRKRNPNPRKRMSPADRLLSKVDRNGPLPEGRPELGRCWVYHKINQRTGYGSFALEGRTTSAHRASYRLFVGPIPARHDVEHICRNRRCVNPAHLEPVTRQENLRRAFAMIPGGEDVVQPAHIGRICVEVTDAGTARYAWINLLEIAAVIDGEEATEVILKSGVTIRCLAKAELIVERLK